MSSSHLVGSIVSLLGSGLVAALFSRKQNLGGANSRLHDLEKQLETARGEAYVQHEILTSLQSQLEKSAEQIKARDAKIAELESKVEASAAATAESSASKAEIEVLKAEAETLRRKLAEAQTEAEAAVKAETDSLRLKLVEAEAALHAAAAKPPEPDPATVAELETLRKTVLSQNNDVAKLLERVKELAPLKLQITDRDLRLRQQEARLTEAEKSQQAVADIAAKLERKDDEIAALNDKLAELEHDAAAKAQRILEISELTTQHEFMLGEKDSEIADLQSQLAAQSAADENSVLRDKDAAISLLQLRVKELEPLTAQLAERDLKLRRLEEQLEDAQQASTSETPESREREAEKDAEIARLQTQILEMESARLKVAAELATAVQSDDGNGKDEEVTALRMRVAELEPLKAQLFARDARLIELEARLQSAIQDKEAETKHFSALVAELEPSGARAEAAEARLKEAEERHQTTVNNLEVEISGLRVKLASLEGAREMLEDCLAKLRAIEAKAEEQ
ncbi:MAG TPA: hypothetical protein PLK30_16450 [Blastocatellia bacterium]|nr:hypothetical protein [Blastocatellia bacterium]